MTPQTQPAGAFLVHVMKTGGTSVGRMLRDALAGPTYPDPRAGQGPMVKLGIDRILALDAAERTHIRTYSVHMPAWVAEAVAPSHLKVTVLREPVARTISHLRHIARMDRMPSDPEEIYDDEPWRRRLADLQTRLFADTAELHAARRRKAESMRTTMKPEGLQRTLDLTWSTGAPDARELDDADLDRAIERLETFDVVGVTSDLAGLARRVASKLAIELPSPEHANKAPNELPVSDELRARIVADTRKDAQLFGRACELASGAD